MTDTRREEDSALGHSFTNYISNGDATCLEDGTETAKCDRCNVTDTRTEEDTALGHSFTNYISNGDATCLEDGTETAKCDRCEVTDTQTEVNTALGHSHTVLIERVPSTCIEKGHEVYKCSRCDSTETTGLPLAKHDYTLDPCTCCVCGHVRIQTAVASVALRPSAAGVYFSGSFSIDEDAPVLRYGIAVSLITRSPLADSRTADCMYTSGSYSVLISNIMNITNTEVENGQNAAMAIYARSYVLLEGDVYIYSDAVAVNLLQLLQIIDDSWDTLTASQKSAVTAMYATFAYTLKFYDLPRIKEEIQ